MEKVKLTRKNGVLKVDIDGEIIEPLSFKSFRPTERNISDFASAGVKLFSILSSGMISLLEVPYSLYGESWLDDDVYDFEPVDRQIELFMKSAPEGYFALMIQLDTRPWYIKKHNVPYTFTNLSQTIADEEWRRRAADYLKAMIRHTEEKYGDRFYGYFMLCGFTTEWFSHFDEEAPSDIKEKAYKEYLNDPDARIPDKDILEQNSNEAFLAENTREEVEAYRKFHAELIADSILYFAAEAQSVLKHKKLLGVYFGYLFELVGSRLWNDGHLAYEKVFTSPDIDMISSPSSYAFRRGDSTSAFMVTFDTLDRHNKLYYLEFDHITHLAPPDVDGILIPGGDSKLPDHIHTLNVMQRDFMLCAAKGAALWWFDMFEGWFYSDEMMSAIRDMIEISKRFSEKEQKSVSEIAVIASGKDLYCVNKNSGLNDLCLGEQREGLARMGAPYDVFSACDADEIDVSRYKLFIFLDSFEPDEKLRNFIEKLKETGKTILWIYAPDYAANGLAGMQKITDMNIVKLIGDEDTVNTHFGKLHYKSLPRPRFFIEDADAVPLGIYKNTEKVAIGAKRFGTHTSVYSAVGNLDGDTLRDIAKTAGVKIYSFDSSVPVYVNSLFLGVYGLKDAEICCDSGVYTDVFTDKKYVSENGKMHIPAGKFASKLLVKDEE